MPVVSKAQNRFFRWAEAHPQESGVKPLVSHEFVQSMHGQHIRDLPERVTHKAEGGAVSARSYPPPFRW